jgi:hypothetical protein
MMTPTCFEAGWSVGGCPDKPELCGDI